MITCGNLSWGWGTSSRAEWDVVYVHVYVYVHVEVLSRDIGVETHTGSHSYLLERILVSTGDM